MKYIFFYFSSKIFFLKFYILKNSNINKIFPVFVSQSLKRDKKNLYILAIFSMRLKNIILYILKNFRSNSILNFVEVSSKNQIIYMNQWIIWNTYRLWFNQIYSLSQILYFVRIYSMKFLHRNIKENLYQIYFFTLITLLTGKFIIPWY